METQKPAPLIGYDQHVLVSLRTVQDALDPKFGRGADPVLQRLLKDHAPFGDCVTNGPDALPAALYRLFTTTNRLRSLARLSPREQVAVPAGCLDALRHEIDALERRVRAVDVDNVKYAVLAFKQVVDLTNVAAMLAKERYQTPNWAAKVGIVWLKLRALAAVLSPVAPDIAMRLSSLLTGGGPSWPRLEGIQGVRLHLIPC